MGELCAIRSTIIDRIPGVQRVMLTLRLGRYRTPTIFRLLNFLTIITWHCLSLYLIMCRDAIVCVSMFDSLAQAFHNKLDGYGKEPRIVVATGVNPKMVSGKSYCMMSELYLNGTSATRIFFDSESVVGKVIEFLCTAKVTEIQLGEGWCYIGCSGCSKKLIREDTSFTCVPCDETNAVAKLRYRVILYVSDGTGEAAFLGFDTEMSKLTHVLASEAAQIVGIGINAEVDVVLPRSLADLVGRTYTFQLKLKDFNFTANHQTFTISRVFPQRELAPNPAFASAEEGTGDKGATTSSAADQSTVATKADQMEQTARKKARVE
ncbi:hypothetical protein YC2023_103061 [Brassica napus]